jgi:hypothetical protein
MKKILILSLCIICLKCVDVQAARSNDRMAHYYQEPEPERLMKLFLKAVQGNDEKEVDQFINGNYSKRFLEIPLSAHQKVIGDLHRDFSHYIVSQTIKNYNKITVIIRSPVNKTKRITIETDGNVPGKILFVDIKDS